MKEKMEQQPKLHINIHYVATEYVNGQRHYVRRSA